MARIFISHSSTNNDRAVELRDWLVANGWDDFFLDLDPEHGIVAGEKWKEALKQAAHRCEAVLALVSPEWLSRDWCRAELASAEMLGKKIFVLLIGSENSDLASSLKDAQYVDLINDPDAYTRLKEGLKRAGLDPTSFPFEEGRRPYPGFAPLEEEDAAIFFGRDAQIVRGLDKLRGLVRGGVERVFFILGASGSGKSSFLRAGLLPRLKRDDIAWLPLPTIRPERAAITGKFGLVEALYGLIDADRFKEKLDKDIPRSRAAIEELVTTRDDGLATILEALRQAGRVSGSANADTPPPTIVIAIDQGEELFNDEGRDEDERFIEILSRTLERDRGALVVLTMRTDSFPQVQNHPVLSALLKDTFTLDRMPEGSYRTVIEGPAALVKPPLKVDPQLTEALLEDASGQDALALLAFTLRHLHDRYQADNALTLEGYEKLGRLKGVIEAAVNEALAEGASRGELPKDKAAQLALIRMAFIPHLARVNAAGEFVRRVASRAEIPAEARPLVDRFADARLLVKDRRRIGGEDDSTEGATSGAEPQTEDAEVIEVAHEALLREWGDLNSALDEEKEFLKDKAQLERDLADWQEAPEDSKPGALLTGNKLVRAQDWLIKHPIGITDDERRFIQASADAEAARRNRELEEARKLAEAQKEAADKQRTVARRTRIGLIAASVLALAAIAGAGWAWRAQQVAEARTAEAEQATSRAEFATSRAEGARFSALAQLPDRATEALVGAIRLISADLRGGKPLAPEAVRGLGDAMRAVGYEVPDKHVLTGHKGDVTSVAWSPDGTRLLTTSEDGTVRLWDPFELTEIASYAWPDGLFSQGVTSDAFTRDGKRAVVATTEGRALVLDASSGATIATLEGHEDEVMFAAYAGDDAYILTTGSGDGKVLMWNAETFEIDKTFADLGAVLFADLSPDGKHLASGGQHQTVVIWTVEDQSVAFGGQAVRSDYDDLDLGDWIRTGAFSGNRYVIAANERGAGIIWDMHEERVVRIGDGMGRIDSSSFAKGIAAMGDEVVDLGSNPPDLQVKLERVGGNEVTFSTLSRDGEYMIATVTADDVARVYETATGRRVATLEGHEQSAKGAVLSAAFRPRGTPAVATASRDGTVRLWNLVPDPEVPEIPDDDAAIDREAVAKLLERACWMLRNRPAYDEVRADCEQDSG